MTTPTTPTIAHLLRAMREATPQLQNDEVLTDANRFVESALERVADLAEEYATEEAEVVNSPDMVLVPRELLERIQVVLCHRDETRGDEYAELRALLGGGK